MTRTELAQRLTDHASLVEAWEKFELGQVPPKEPPPPLIGTSALLREAAAEVERLREATGFLGHVIVAAGGKVVIQQQQLVKCRYPLIKREDRRDNGDIVLSAALQEPRP